MKWNETMDYREIEGLKSFLMDRLREGYRISIDPIGIDGKLIGIGFRPYWTNLGDSKIDKLEFNILKDNGQIIPIRLNNLVGYKITAQDDISSPDVKNLNLHIMLYSPNKLVGEDPYDRINLRLYK